MLSKSNSNCSVQEYMRTSTEKSGLENAVYLSLEQGRLSKNG